MRYSDENPLLVRDMFLLGPTHNNQIKGKR